MQKKKSPLTNTVDRTQKEYDAPVGLTLQYCALEIYEESEDYGRSGQSIIDQIIANDKKCSYAIMKHDNDFFSENTFNYRKELIGTKGQKKKNHWHVIIGFPYRVSLSDVALWLNIPDRFITKLKGEKDFDNMLVYLTHIKYPEDQKTHYPMDLLISNITEYVQFLYDRALKEIEENQTNIVTYVIGYLIDVHHKIDYSKLITDLQINYQINDVLKYLRIIEKLVQEHNHRYDMVDENAGIKAKLQAVQNDCVELQKNCDVLAEDNMRLRGMDIDEKKVSVFE